jgi:hypothetical protein
MKGKSFYLDYPAAAGSQRQLSDYYPQTTHLGHVLCGLYGASKNNDPANTANTF